MYVFRAYHSMPVDMVDDNGNPVNALYGFCRFIGDFMEQVTPEYIAIMFDQSMTECFRTEIYPEYNAITSRRCRRVGVTGGATSRRPVGVVTITKVVERPSRLRWN